MKTEEDYNSKYDLMSMGFVYFKLHFTISLYVGPFLWGFLFAHFYEYGLMNIDLGILT